jgi:hypothetical protein
MLKMGKSFYGVVAGVMFLAGGTLHGYRALSGFDIMYGDWLVPMWLSWLVVLVAFLMALITFKNLK